MTTSSGVDPAPFDLAGALGGPAALCLHGLTGTPYEVRPLAEALAKRGIRARGPALPGHDSTPEDLRHVPHAAWLDAARAELRGLRKSHDSIFVVGISMGGLLALALAAEVRVSALAVVGVPLRFGPLVRAFAPLAKRVVPFLDKRVGSDIRDPEARARHPSYDVMPLASVHELIRLQRIVRSGLGRVEDPILIAHGVHDKTANPRDARELARLVSSSEVEVLMLERSGHVCTVDYDGPRLADAIGEFLLRHASVEPTTAHPAASSAQD